MENERKFADYTSQEKKEVAEAIKNQLIVLNNLIAMAENKMRLIVDVNVSKDHIFRYDDSSEEKMINKNKIKVEISETTIY